MSRFLLILCCMAVASSCASTRAPTASELAAYQKPSIAPECPTPTSVVPADRCDALPAGYGVSRDQPLEWGVFAARGDKQGPLYFGRLLCADGTQAIATPKGFAPLVGTSSSPSSMSFQGAAARPGDVVDELQVHCGEETVTLYANPYRCGSPCAPAGFRVMTADVKGHLYRISQHLKAEEREAALQEAEAALALDPDNEETHASLSFLLFQLARFEDSLLAADEGIAKVPASLTLPMLRGQTLVRIGRFEEAYQTLRDLVPRLEARGDDQRLPLVLNFLALSARATDREDEARAIYQRRCEKDGDAGSCDSLKRLNAP